VLVAGMGKDIDWRQKLCRSQGAAIGATGGDCSPEAGGGERPPEEDADDDAGSPGPLEMMPCLGRHAAVAHGMESPTLSRVREVYNRRDAMDAKWVEERREQMARRLALNSFKAREQQRELQLQVFKQKELHKVRMLEAEGRKANHDAISAERADLMGAAKAERLEVANEKRDMKVEQKREAATCALENWEHGVRRAANSLRDQEIERHTLGKHHTYHYMNRLSDIGEARHNRALTQAQRNDELKKTIQTSLSKQIKERQAEDAVAASKAIDAKLEGAERRRQEIRLHNRYKFAEKAFGAHAPYFDHKHHAVSVDRRSRSWQQSAEAWEQLKPSYSMPSFSVTRTDDVLGDMSKVELGSFVRDARPDLV